MVDGDAQRLDGAAVQEHGPALWAYLRRCTSDAEDVYQEVWARALGGRFDPKGPSSLRMWLFTVASRLLVDRWRRLRVRWESVSHEDLPAAPTGSVLDRLAVERALGELPEPIRAVVVLHHVHDLDLPTIAVALGVAVGTVKSRLHRGRARLAAALGGP